MSVMRRVHRPQAAMNGHPDVPRRTDGAIPVVPRPRAGTAWVGACVGAVTGLALIIFIAQNVHTVDVAFLVWRGRFPLAVAMLAAALLGAVLTLVLGSTRIVQLGVRHAGAVSARPRAPGPVRARGPTRARDTNRHRRALTADSV